MGKEWDNFSGKQKSYDSAGERAKANADKEKLKQYRGGSTPFAFSSSSGQSTKQDRTAFIAFMTDVMSEALRVLKPGGHALIWSLPRTSHWTATALEDAGFEIRDCVYHVFSTGFPKSLDISKAIDKMAGKEREVVGIKKLNERDSVAYTPSSRSHFGSHEESQPRYITAPATPEAASWAGWGSALKPSVENWILCRKPLAAHTIAENVLTYGTGGLNIGASRVNPGEVIPGGGNGKAHNLKFFSQETQGTRPIVQPHTQGRYPSHLLLSHANDCTEGQCAPECAIAELDRQSGNRKSGGGDKHGRKSSTFCASTDWEQFKGTSIGGDEGGASRFFATFQPEAPFIYCPKASRRDRSANGTVENTHPTVKSTALISYLSKLICPPGGIILDCFAGSGTLGVCAVQNGFHYILIEQDLQYVKIAEARIAHALRDRDTVAPKARPVARVRKPRKAPEVSLWKEEE